MDKDMSLQCIDYAAQMTQEKGGAFNTNAALAGAINGAMFQNNYIGFTSKNDARKFVAQLSFEDFEQQLLKNVVKYEMVSQKYGVTVQLGTRKDFDNVESIDDIQCLMYRTIKEMDMEAVKYLLDKYPILYKGMISKFVESRYFNEKFGIDRLDEDSNDYENKYLLNKIDNYYKGLKKEDSMQY